MVEATDAPDVGFLDGVAREGASGAGLDWAQPITVGVGLVEWIKGWCWMECDGEREQTG